MRFIVLLLILLLPSLARAQGGVKAGPWSTNVPPAPIYGNNTTTVSNTVTHIWWDFWGTNPMTVAHLEDVTNIVNGSAVGSQVWTNDGQFIYWSGQPPVVPSSATPGPMFFFSTNGSIFIGQNVNQDANALNFSYRQYYDVSFTASNDPENMLFSQTVVDSEDYNYWAYWSFLTHGDDAQGRTTLDISARLLNGDHGSLQFDSDPSHLNEGTMISISTNGKKIFQAGEPGFTNYGPMNISGLVTNHGSETIKGQTRLWQNVFVGASGADLFEVDASSGNIEIIRGVTSYSWPLSHSTGALTNNGDGQLGWFDGFLTSSATNALSAKFSVMSNGVVVAASGGITNFDFQNFSLVGSNNGTLTISNASSSPSPGIPSLDPFVVIDNTPYYPTNPWNHIVSEEWQGDATASSIPLGATHAWTFANAGNTIFRVAPLVESSAFSYLSTVMTNAGTANTYFLGGSVSPALLLATNVEIIFSARIRIGLTNTSGQVQKCIVGLSSSVSANEPANGIYITVNTNVNTNSFVGCTAQASSRTFTYNTHSSNVWAAMTWVNVGFRLDSTGTNATFFVGPSLTNLTTFATNTTFIPNSVLTGPVFTVHRITGTGGATRMTNYCDNVHMWVRNLNSNN